MWQYQIQKIVQVQTNMSSAKELKMDCILQLQLLVTSCMNHDYPNLPLSNPQIIRF